MEHLMLQYEHQRINKFLPLPIQLQLNGLSRAIARVTRTLERTVGAKQRRLLQDRIAGLAGLRNQLIERVGAAA
jgi:hypothetical protein